MVRERISALCDGRHPDPSQSGREIQLPRQYADMPRGQGSSRTNFGRQTQKDTMSRMRTFGLRTYGPGKTKGEIMFKAFNSVTHSHICSDCRLSRICTLSPCPYRGTEKELTYCCRSCREIKDTVFGFLLEQAEDRYHKPTLQELEEFFIEGMAL